MILLFVVCTAFSQGNETRNNENIPNVTPVEVKVTSGKNDLDTQIKVFGPEYFPLNYNYIYHFKSNAGETVAEIDTIGNERIISFETTGISYCQNLLRKEDGIYLTRTKSSAFLFFGSDIIYPKPALRLQIPIKIGDNWRWNGFEVADGDTGLLSIEGVAMGEEEIATPAGVFQCLKIQQNVVSIKGSSSIVTEWLAPDIGIIKSHSILKGVGITALIQELFGLDEITFELSHIEKISSDHIHD